MENSYFVNLASFCFKNPFRLPRDKSVCLVFSAGRGLFPARNRAGAGICGFVGKTFVKIDSAEARSARSSGSDSEPMRTGAWTKLRSVQSLVKVFEHMCTYTLFTHESPQLTTEILK